MKDIAEKCPKAWELYEKWYLYEKHTYRTCSDNKVYISDNLQFLQHFGYLVLEFFPKHGIEIDKDGESYQVWMTEGENESFVSRHHTPKKAIEKAFEILEVSDEQHNKSGAERLG